MNEHYYNENDPSAAAWLRQLISDGLIPAGDVDTRSIVEVQPDDVRHYTQCHFFAGIGGWPEALRLAGWGTTRAVWTGSCPCQPFSSAGKQKGHADARHLWPEMSRLVRECKPAIIFGEQVESAVRHGWLDGVFADLEAAGYACGAIVLGAHSVGAPHIRQRLFWVADATGCRYASAAGPTTEIRETGRAAQWGPQSELPRKLQGRLERCGDARGMADTTIARRAGPEDSRPDSNDAGQGVRRLESERSGDVGRLGVTLCTGLEGLAGHGDLGDQPGWLGTQPLGPTSETGGAGGMAHANVPELRGLPPAGQQPEHEQDAGDGFWFAFDLIPCRDGKQRRTQRGLFPLVAGLPRSVVRGGNQGAPIDAQASAEARVMRLRGYGNAINTHLAAAFIGAYMECEVAA